MRMGQDCSAPGPLSPPPPIPLIQSPELQVASASLSPLTHSPLPLFSLFYPKILRKAVQGAGRMAFIELNDGSSFLNLQVLLTCLTPSHPSPLSPFPALQPLLTRISRSQHGLNNDLVSTQIQDLS